VATSIGFSTLWVISSDFHIRVTEVYLNYVSFWILYVDGELFGSTGSSEGLVEYSFGCHDINDTTPLGMMYSTRHLGFWQAKTPWEPIGRVERYSHSGHLFVNEICTIPIARKTNGDM